MAKGAILGYLHELPELTALKSTYLRLIDQVFDAHPLDGLVYPQMLEELPGLHSGLAIRETTIGELNIAGLPGITIPAGRFASGAPFGLIFLRRLWSGQSLLDIAHDYQQDLPC